MLDIKFIRDNPQKVKDGLRKRGAQIDVDHVLELDKEKREGLAEIEALRAKHNELSNYRSLEKGGEANRIAEAAALKSAIKNLEVDYKNVEARFDSLILQMPNLPFDDVPEGKDESYNKVIREVGASGEPRPVGRGKLPKFNFAVKDHLEIGERLGLIDVKRAGKIAGSRFGILKNQAALLEFALVKYAFDVLTKQGFMPVIPPVMLKPEMLQKMGYLDTEEDKAERYFVNEKSKDNQEDTLVLVGTSEQAIGPMRADEMFNEQDLPVRYVGFSTCFREEAGSYGKDTRGILRVHQFDKVEMFSFAHPEKSKDEHKFMIEMEEKLMQGLRLPYRVMHLCAGDMARVSASTFDIEAWMPGQNKYRETHSCSNCTDFQSRRLNIRYKDSKTKKPEFVHTLNGTAFAIGRTLIAILENYQKKNGDIEIPKVLQKYCGFKQISSK